MHFATLSPELLLSLCCSAFTKTTWKTKLPDDLFTRHKTPMTTVNVGWKILQDWNLDVAHNKTSVVRQHQTHEMSDFRQPKIHIHITITELHTQVYSSMKNFLLSLDLEHSNIPGRRQKAKAHKRSLITPSPFGLLVSAQSATHQSNIKQP